MRSDYVLYALTLVIPLVALFQYLGDTDTEPETSAPEIETKTKSDSEEKKSTSGTTIMQSERSDLPAPKDDPYTQEQLKAYDGGDQAKPIYVAIKGAPSSCATPCHALTQDDRM
jgi:hypothetical protein